MKAELPLISSFSSFFDSFFFAFFLAQQRKIINRADGMSGGAREMEGGLLDSRGRRDTAAAR
jgi:hypothetical protein